MIDIRMVHRWVSMVVAVLFVVTIQTFTSPVVVFRELVPAVVFFILLLQAYHYFYLHKSGIKAFWIIVRSGLLLLALAGTFLLLPSPLLRGLFLVGTAALLAVAELWVDSLGEQFVMNSTLLTAFCLFLSAWGMGYYFFNSSLYIMATCVVALLLLLRGVLDIVPQSSGKKWLGALLLSLWTTEIFWALSFLPLHYSALAVLSFAFFYAIWALYYYALFHAVTAKRLQFHLIVASLVALVTLLATPWKAIT